MTVTRSACQPHWVHGFWTDELSSDQLEQFEQHLAVCELCQSRFDEALAAQDIMETLNDSRDQLIGVDADSCHIANPSPLQGTARVEQHDHLRSIAKRLFPATPVPKAGHAAVRDNSNAVDDGAEIIGTIDHFDLLEPLGSGGMGFVYKAYDRRLHRLVALKVLSPSVATTGAARQRFMREAQAAANIASPHVVPIHAVSQCEGLPYLVMSLVDGPDLQYWILQHGPMSVIDSLRVARQVAEGLLAAHDQGVIHRDVKPANILFQPTILQASLTDFGLAMVADQVSLTHSGLAPGTPSFMSPEQARGETIDHRSDWYSFGCVLYTMLVGHPPFRGPHAMAVLTRLQSENPKPPSDYRPELPDWLDRLTLRLLHRDAALRLGDGTTIVQWLGDCVAHLENPQHHDLPGELVSHRKRKISNIAWLVLASGCACALLVAGLLVRSSSEPGDNVSQVLSSDPMTVIDPATLRRHAAIEAEVQLRLNEFKAMEQSQDRELQDLDAALSRLEALP